MRTFVLSFLALSCVATLMVAAPKPASAEPKVLPIAWGQTAGKVEEIGYRYRRYRYGYRPYYYRRYGYYRPYYRPYAYYRPYYGPYYGYYGYPYYYRPYYRPGLSFWFGF
jgi:hypothetical protein